MRVLVALVKRYRIPQILTLDRRHFGLIQTEKINYLGLADDLRGAPKSERRILLAFSHVEKAAMLRAAMLL